MPKSSQEFIDQQIITPSADEACLFDNKHIEALLHSDAFPSDTSIKGYSPRYKADLVSNEWVCFLHYPFTLGMKYPFPALVKQFFETTGPSYAQAMPMVWKILFSLNQLNETRNLGIGLPEIAASYQLRTHGSSRFVLQSRDGSKHMIPRHSHSDNDWKRRFFFVKRSSIPGGDKLPLYWVKKAFKIEDLVKPTADTQRKLELLYQIPNRERACLSETATSEASFSSDHTPDMSSAIPKPVGKFSLADIKNKITKKEKSEETVAAKPIHSPATRSRATGKKRKTVDPVILLDSFDGLSAMEVKDKMHALHSTMNLGFEQLHELLRIQEEELQRSREAYDDLKTISEQKDGYYRQKEENLLKEIEDNKVKAEKEREKVVDEAQESAATAVVESMFEMAKDAKAAGFSLPKWDLEGWAKILGRMDELVETDSQAAGVATAEGASVEEGAGRDVPVGDEGKDAQA